MKTNPLFKAVLPSPKSKGEDILWLHGWGQTHQSLLGLAGLFKRDFNNTLYDLPGFGRSAMLDPAAGTADYADVFITEIEGNFRGPVILVGHSFGCRIAVRLAAERPDLVRSMVLIAAAGLPRRRGLGFKIKRFFLKILGKAASGTDGIFKTGFKEKFRNRFGSRDYRTAGPLRQTLVKTVTEDLSDQARKISCPVLLLYGANDLETPPELGQRYQGLIPDANLKILDGFDHLGILTTGLHRCQHYMTPFLREKTPDE